MHAFTLEVALNKMRLYQSWPRPIQYILVQYECNIEEQSKQGQNVINKKTSSHDAFCVFVLVGTPAVGSEHKENNASVRQLTR